MHNHEVAQEGIEKLLSQVRVRRITWRLKKQLGNLYPKLLEFGERVAQMGVKEGEKINPFELLKAIYEVFTLEEIEKLVNLLCENCNLDEMSDLEILAFLQKVIEQIIISKKS